MTINNENKRTQKQINADLVKALKTIEENGLNLPLIPLNGNKQPLGDNWQQRPMSAKQLGTAIAKTGSIKVPITINKGKDNQKQVIKDLPIQGFGILLGHPVNYQGAEYCLTAIDVDGPSAKQLIPKLYNNAKLPATVCFTSHRKGRFQALYLVPKAIAPHLKYKKIKTGVKGDDGKDEALEFRWSRQQSVLPPSVHPTTGKYSYFNGYAIAEKEIAIAPTWVLLQMLQTDTVKGKLIKLALENNIPVKFDGDRLHHQTLSAIDEQVNIVEIVQPHIPLRKSGKDMIGECPFHDDKGEHLIVNSSTNTYYCSVCEATGKTTKFVSSIDQQLLENKRDRASTNSKRSEQTNQKDRKTKTVVAIPAACDWTDKDWAIYYVLNLATSRANDYHEWISVGMALKSIDESLLSVYESFSQRDPKYKAGECEKKWYSFGREGITIATIFEWAKEDKVSPPDESYLAVFALRGRTLHAVLR